MKVDIYYNLRRNCLSVKCKETNRVIHHTLSIDVHDVEFIVSEKARQRVLVQKRKNVHAYIRGTIDLKKQPERYIPYDVIRVKYDPYKYSDFVEQHSETPIKNAKIVYIRGSKVYASLN
jgi:hypothetical protein